MMPMGSMQPASHQPTNGQRKCDSNRGKMTVCGHCALNGVEWRVAHPSFWGFGSDGITANCDGGQSRVRVVVKPMADTLCIRVRLQFANVESIPTLDGGRDAADKYVRSAWTPQPLATSRR